MGDTDLIYLERALGANGEGMYSMLSIFWSFFGHFIKRMVILQRYIYQFFFLYPPQLFDKLKILIKVQ
jgi:hypothetical protein